MSNMRTRATNMSNPISQLQQLNAAETSIAVDFFLSCCASIHWAEQLEKRRPFHDAQALLSASDEIWQSCQEKDILEAFAGHPQIGDLTALKNKFATSASAEQGQIVHASESTLLALQQRNIEYKEKFGFIFIVCASGKSAEEMLGLLEERIVHHYDEELAIGASEQNKITHLRLMKYLHLA